MKLKNQLPAWLYNPLIKAYDRFINSYYQKSFAQEGEDIVLQRFVANISNGFYVDIGAHHPKRFSNTYLYYIKGWRGINVEPRPGSKKLFDKYRPGDINLELPVNSLEEELTYYMFNEPALNGFSKEVSGYKDGLGEYKIINEIKMKTRTLKNILDEFLPSKQKINFMNVDVEGLDIKVLESNNWEKYKPDIILCEDNEFQVSNPKNSSIYVFLTGKGYKIVAKTFNTLIFKVDN